MSDSSRCYPSTENQGDTGAGALAYNKNLNILFAPYCEEPIQPACTKESTDKKDVLAPVNEELRGLMKTLWDDNYTEPEAAAYGKANIENINLNFIITL